MASARAVVSSKNDEIASRKPQRLSNQLPELSVANEKHSLMRLDADLLLDLERRSQRLGKDSLLIGHPIGNNMKILGRKGQILGKRAVTPDNSKDRAL